MKSKSATLILSLGLLLTCTSAQALMNTSELLSICESGLQNPIRDNPKYSFCSGAMLGILMTDAIEKNLICLPSEVDTKSAMRLFVQRARREPHKDIEGFATMYRAFLETYPCKKK
jgi:hypothetical protein